MSLVTKMYAGQLLPLLRLNLSQLNKPVPDDATLNVIAIKIIEDLEAKHVPLKSSSLSYAAFYYANLVAPGAAAPAAAAVGDQLSKQTHALVVADLVPIARAALAARHGDAAGLDDRAVDVASKLATHLDTLAS